MKYKLETFKNTVTGDFQTQDEAIRELADQYLTKMKCYPPRDKVSTAGICRAAYLSVKEEGPSGKWKVLSRVEVFPFNINHWHDDGSGQFPRDCEFKYRIT